MVGSVVTYVMDQQTTDANRALWVSPTRKLPGLRELRWFEQNEDAMRPFEGRWVAIKGTRVVKDGASFEEVHDAVSADGIHQALIVYVQESSPDIYDIA